MKKPFLIPLGLAAACAGLLLLGLLPAREPAPVAEANAAERWQWELPVHFPQPSVPADSPMSEERFQLGRRLFYDTRLSGNGTQACASCHLQRLAFTDGRAVSIGSTGEPTPRNAPSIANVVYLPTLTWANYTLTTLERHAQVPMFGELPTEMGINDSNQAEVIGRFRDDPDYALRFAAAFPGESEPVNFHNLVKALGSFMRGVISAGSRYDRYKEGKLTLSAAEARGEALFRSEKAQCFHCHGSFNFNDQVVHAASGRIDKPFHNTGLYNIDGKGGFPAPNRGILELSGKAKDMGAFRAPSLRNVALTAPYMHDGSITTLEEVLEFYAGHGRNIESGPYAGDGRANPFKDPRVDRIELSAQDKADLVAFLRTLTDEGLLTNPRYANPFLPPATGTAGRG